MGEPDWAGLTAPLFREVLHQLLLQVAGTPEPFLLDRYVVGHVPADVMRIAGNERYALMRLRWVCRQWRDAVDEFVGKGRWFVAVEAEWLLNRGSRRAVEQLSVEELRVVHFEMDPVKGPTAGLAALLRSKRFQARSGATLRCAMDLPERLVGALAAFTRLETVALLEDPYSTITKPHGTPMRLAALHSLPELRSLTLNFGIVAINQLPPGLTELSLNEVDRIQLPPGSCALGDAATDRLLSAAEAHGLRMLRVSSSSDSIVFEKADRVPLELEMSHVLRLLRKRTLTADTFASHWSVNSVAHRIPLMSGVRRLQAITLSRQQRCG